MFNSKIVMDSYAKGYECGRNIGFEEAKMIIEAYARNHSDSELLAFVESLKILKPDERVMT